MTSVQAEVERLKATLSPDAPAHRIIVAFKASNHYQHGTTEYDLWRAFLRFSDKTIELIANTVEWYTAQTGPEREFAYSMLTEYDESSVRRFMLFLPQFTTDFDTYESREVITGLAHLERFKDQPQIDFLTGEEFNIAVAFLNVTAALYDRMDDKYLAFYDDRENPAGYIKDTRYQEFVIQNYRQSDAIAQYIRERGIVDAEAIKDYLDNGTALNTGVL